MKQFFTSFMFLLSVISTALAYGTAVSFDDYLILKKERKILQAFEKLNELALQGDKQAKLEMAMSEIYTLAYREAVKHQNAVIEPLDNALPLYAIALGDPEKRWEKAIIHHIDFLMNNKDTFGADYENDEMRNARMDAFGSTVRRTIGRTGLTIGNYKKTKRELSVGEIFVVGMGALILWDINNAIEGKGPKKPPVSNYQPPDSCKSTSFLRYSNSSWGTAMGMFGCSRY